MERSENRRQPGPSGAVIPGQGIAPAGGMGARFDPAFNFAEAGGLGIQWRPCISHDYPIDVDASLRFTRFAKDPLDLNAFPNPATFPGGNGAAGIGAWGFFMPMQDAYAIAVSFAKSPWGPGVNSIPANSTFWGFSMMQFPTLPKQNG